MDSTLSNWEICTNFCTGSCKPHTTKRTVHALAQPVGHEQGAQSG